MSLSQRVNDLALSVAAQIKPLRAGMFATLNTTTEHVGSTPTPPATGVRLFTRHRARRLLAIMGPSGQDTVLQPAFFSNRVGMIVASNNNATPNYVALPAITAYTASTAVAIAATSFFTAITRLRFPGGSTIAATQAGFRHSNLFHLSSTANKGGFFWVLRCGISAGQANSGRGAFGLFLSTAALAAAEPTTLASWVGFGWGSTDTTMKVYSNDASGTATVVADLGTNFPTQNYGTYFYEFRLFAPSGGGSQVWWSATRLNDNITVTGGPITTDLPALDTLLGTQAVIGSLAASTIALDVAWLYVETDN